MDIYNLTFSLNAENNSYFISFENGKIREQLIPAEIIR